MTYVHMPLILPLSCRTDSRAIMIANIFDIAIYQGISIWMPLWKAFRVELHIKGSGCLDKTHKTKTEAYIFKIMQFFI